MCVCAILLCVCIHTEELPELKKDPSLQNEMLTKYQTERKKKTSIYKKCAVQNSIGKEKNLKASSEKNQATYKGLRILDFSSATLKVK